jgi:16S rRNA (adenine1518-N6/adenine1519-N6)-dimethyltransferase
VTKRRSKFEVRSSKFQPRSSYPAPRFSNLEPRTSNLERTSSPPPLKRLGQHFLVDPNIVRKIIAAAGVHADDTVLEIGPGRGILTRALCAAAKRVVALEIDPQLHAVLAKQLPDCTNVDLHLCDALAFDYESLSPGTIVVANLPYYLSTPLLGKLLESRRRLNRLVIMVQTEVARRLAAKPGSDEYGRLSVLAQYTSDVRVQFQVSPACFRPRPRVGSAVVSLAIHRHPPVPVRNEDQFFQIVRDGFAHRRKTLFNSLRDEGWAPDDIAAATGDTGISAGRRAETLTLEEFAALADALGS